jgi:hypothetical protein
MFRPTVALLAPVILSACAGITVTEVDTTTGQRVEKSTNGFRYFLPAPYILVMQLPDDAPPNDGGTTTTTAVPPHGHTRAGPPATGTATGDTGTGAATT